jgi:hypothetical protein
MLYIVLISLILVTLIFYFRWFMATGLILILILHFLGVI